MLKLTADLAANVSIAVSPWPAWTYADTGAHRHGLHPRTIAALARRASGLASHAARHAKKSSVGTTPSAVTGNQKTQIKKIDRSTHAGSESPPRQTGWGADEYAAALASGTQT
ncbi:MAG TPA: hypothetical protein VN668_09255 [Stellaceae bacterium]|nr:hypothetical protein [Stellaceae bacterium]